jgi:periplasmic protein TonB
MQRPLHAVSQAQSQRMSRQRMAAIGAVGVLHVIFIWALVTGMAQKIVKVLPPELQVEVVTTPPAPPTPPSVPKPVQLAPADVPQVPPPVIDIQQSAPTAPVQVTTNTASPGPVAPANTSVSGVMNTHTIPPYPDVAKRLGEQGQVQLHLTISPAGDVTGATVTKSSGFADLDQTAVDWVVAHWKYKPAIQNGAPIASATDAIVKFDLHNAH